MTILQSLSLGQQSAETMSQRCNMSERQLRMEINELRRQGYPIISSDRGYHLSNDINEIERCVARLKSHAASEMQIADSMLKRAHLIGDAVQLSAL